MIVEHEIPIHDRRSLEMAREHLRKQRAEQIEELDSSYNILKNKWTPRKLVYLVSKQFISQGLGNSLGTVIASLVGSVKSSQGKSTKGWKLMFVKALEKTIAPLISKIL